MNPSYDELTLDVIRKLKRPVFTKDEVKGHIYFLFDGDEIVYVGQTTQGEARVFAHRFASERPKQFDAVTMIECPIDKLDELESRFIIEFCPRYNMKLGPSKKYYSRSHPNIKDAFPGHAFRHLVKNYAVRQVQLNGMKNPSYHLDDLHLAALEAVKTGRLVQVAEAPSPKYKYVTKY